VKYYPLVWAALWRKPVRTILTSLSIIVAFLLFGALQGINARFNEIVAEARLDRLITGARFPGGLPLGYLGQIERLPGVTAVTPADAMMGAYQAPENRFPISIVDERWFAVYPPEPRTAVEALFNTRTGALVSDRMAEKFGWKVGDRVPLQARVARKDGSPAWDFEIVAIIRDAGPTQPLPGDFFVQRRYVDEARAADSGMTGVFVVGIGNAAQALEIGAMIDGLFANSAIPTRTLNEKLALESQIQAAVDIGLVTNSVVGIVIFVLAFIISNTMAQSIRERLPEFAVLKTIGFTDNEVLWLALAEALTLCIGGALAGLLAARILMLNLPNAELLPHGLNRIPLIVVPVGLGLSLLLAMLSGIPPAWRVRRLVVVDALAGR
jgi:putative ABC transport system permease protein